MDQITNESLKQGRQVMESDFDLDFDFEFKPVTKGLGFHQKERSPEVKTPIGTSRTMNLARSAPQKVMHEASLFAEERQLTANEIAAIHGGAKQFDKAQTKNPISKPNPIEADPVIQTLAFIFDLAIVLGLSVSTLVLFAFVSPYKISELNSLIQTKQMLFWGIGFFGLFFVTYFSFMEVGTTVGKSVFKIRTVARNGKNLSLGNAFARTVVTLLSFLAIGVPFLFDFQGKLSDSIVIK